MVVEVLSGRGCAGGTFIFKSTVGCSYAYLLLRRQAWGTERHVGTISMWPLNENLGMNEGQRREGMEGEDSPGKGPHRLQRLIK